MRLLRGPPGGAAGGTSEQSPPGAPSWAPAGPGKTRLALQVAARLSGEGGAEESVPGRGLAGGAGLARRRPARAPGRGRRPRRARGARGAGAGRRHRLAPPAARCCSCWTTASTWWTPAPPSPRRPAGGLPGLRILATSREPLGHPRRGAVAPAHACPRPDLQAPRRPPERLAGLRRRAPVRRAGPGGRTPASPSPRRTPPAVARICRRLDGMPLALELAAARARVLSVEQIAARLDDRFRLLTGGSRTAPPSSRPCGRRWTGATTCSPSPSARSSPAWPSSPGASPWRRPSRSAPASRRRRARRRGRPRPPLPAGGQVPRRRRLRRRRRQRAGGPAETRYRLPETVREYAAERLAARRRRPPSGRPTRATSPAWPRSAGPALSGPRQALLARPAGAGARQPARRPARRAGRGRSGHRPAHGRTAVEVLGRAGPPRRGPALAGRGPQLHRRLASPHRRPARRAPPDATETTALARGNSAAGSLARGAAGTTPPPAPTMRRRSPCGGSWMTGGQSPPPWRASGAWPATRATTRAPDPSTWSPWPCAARWATSGGWP